MAHIKKALIFPQLDMKCQGRSLSPVHGQDGHSPNLLHECTLHEGQSELEIHAVLSAFS